VTISTTQTDLQFPTSTKTYMQTRAHTARTQHTHKVIPEQQSEHLFWTLLTDDFKLLSHTRLTSNWTNWTTMFMAMLS